jgi:hypothetical protein
MFPSIDSWIIRALQDETAAEIFGELRDTIVSRACLDS